MDNKQIIITGIFILAIGITLFIWSSNRLSDYNPLAAQVAGPSTTYQQLYQNFVAVQMVSSYVLLGGIVLLGYGMLKRRKLKHPAN